MGRVVIVHTRNDAAFSARVITYLRQRNFSVEARVVAASAPLNLAPDEVDHVCVVHASSLHEQPSTEEVVMRSQAARGSSGALSVIPILQAGLALPAWADRTRLARFDDFASGMRELLLALGSVTVRAFGRNDHVFIRSARREMAHRFREAAESELSQTAVGYSPLAMTTRGTREASVTVVVQAVGQPVWAPVATYAVKDALDRRLAAGAISTGAESFRGLFAEVDGSIRRVNDEHGFTGRERISCKLGVLVQMEDTVFYAAMGATCLVLRLQRPDGRLVVLRQEPKVRGDATYHELEARNFFVAPIGYLDVDSLEVEPIALELATPGDLAVMTSFAVPMAGDDTSAPWVQALLRGTTGGDRTRALAESLRPRTEECLVASLERVGRS